MSADPMALYRYELHRCSGNLELHDLEGILVFRGHPWQVQGRHNGRFATPCESSAAFGGQSVSAKSGLALGTFPSYCYNLVPGSSAMVICDSYGRVQPEGASFSPSRVWPAFGEVGGAKEVLLTEGKWHYGLFTPCRRVYPEVALGFRADSTRPLGMPFFDWPEDGWPDVIADLSRLVGETFGEAPQQSDEPSGSVKILGPSHVAISWREHRSGRHFTLSCARQDLGGRRWRGEHTLVRFWDYAWEDDEKMGRRTYWGPVTLDHTFAWLEPWHYRDPSLELLRVMEVVHGDLLALLERTKPQTAALIS